MNHDQYQEWLQLSMYDELDDDERRLFEAHLETCTECRSDLDELKRLHSLLAKYQPVEHTEALLYEARSQFRVALRQQTSRRTFWDEVIDTIRETILPQYKLALGGVALLAIGFCVAYLMFIPSSNRVSTELATTMTASPVNEGDTRITNIRFLKSDPESGELEFAFEAVKPMRVKGNINDEQIQKILAHALLTEQNPGVRLQSVSTIAIQKPQDKEIKSALLTSLKTDNNVGVRSETLKALKNFPLDDDIIHGILFVLTHDRNPGIRIAAINYLDSAKVAGRAIDQDILSVLRDRMHADDNNYVRLRAKAVVEEVQQ
jgi:hypothetical protein